MADKWGGGRVTVGVFALMMIGVLGVLYFVGIGRINPPRFGASSRCSCCCSSPTGVGNASTFQMIPNIMRREMDRLMPSADPTARLRRSREGIGRHHRLHLRDRCVRCVLHSEVVTVRPSISLAVSRRQRWGFFIFYVTCIVITWAVYTRKGGLLHDIERRASDLARHPARGIRRREMSHFLDRLTFFTRAKPGFCQRSRRHNKRGPLLGGRLPETLAARQDRAFDARRELHGFLLVEGLRQGRYRHVGNPADRLSAHATRSTQP